MSTNPHIRPRIPGFLAGVLGLVVLALSASLTSCAPASARAMEAGGESSLALIARRTPTINYQATAQSSYMQTSLITAQAQQRQALQQATATERAWQVQQATMQVEQVRAFIAAQAQATATVHAAQVQATATVQSLGMTATPAYATQVAIARSIEREKVQDELAQKAGPWWLAFKISAAFLFMYLVYRFISRLLLPLPVMEASVRPALSNKIRPLPLSERELLTLAHALRRGVPFDERHFGPRTGPNLRAVQEAAVSSGLATWIDPGDPSRGCILTARGKNYFFETVLGDLPAPRMFIRPPLTR